MPRTTPEQVEAILIEVDEGDDLEPFIDVANELVTEVCEPLGYTAGRLEKIERWLSAHFYGIPRPHNFLEMAGTLREQIESKVDLGFNVTRYGQQAMKLDTKGGLATLNAMNSGEGKVRPRRSVIWLGKPAE